MNKEEYEKLSIFNKIDLDIQMQLYDEYNDKIASINDHLGELYGYSDLKDAEEMEMKAEIELYKKALKEKCEEKENLIKYLEVLTQKDEEQLQFISRNPGKGVSFNLSKIELEKICRVIGRTEEILEKVKSGKYE